jgi:hypothetical protein
MRSFGVAVKMEKTPKVTCVILDDAAGAAAVVDSFDLTTSLKEIEDQAHDLAQQLSGRLPGINADVVVLTRADQPQTASKQLARFNRLLVEGALVHAVKRTGVSSCLRDGKTVGSACGSDKQSALDEAATLDKKRQEAAAAALSGLRKAP